MMRVVVVLQALLVLAAASSPYEKNQPRSYRVTYDKSAVPRADEGGSSGNTDNTDDNSNPNKLPLIKDEIEVRCYQFTWLGPWDATNVTENCNYADAMGVPCFEPIVWTDGEYEDNGPDLDALEQQCQEGDTLNGGVCTPTCVKADDQVCVKMTYFLRDNDRTIVNYTSFCGQGFKMTSDAALITDSCHIQHNLYGYDVEACFCDKDRCNDAPRLPLIAVYLMLPLALLVGILQ